MMCEIAFDGCRELYHMIDIRAIKPTFSPFFPHCFANDRTFDDHLFSI